MRSLVISIVLFAILCAVITANFFYINNKVAELSGIVCELSFNNDDTERKISDFKYIWKKCEPIIGLSISYKEIDFLGETFISMSIAYKERNEFEFEKQKALLHDALDGICRLEQFSVMNIF